MPVNLPRNIKCRRISTISCDRSPVCIVKCIGINRYDCTACTCSCIKIASCARRIEISRTWRCPITCPASLRGKFFSTRAWCPKYAVLNMIVHAHRTVILSPDLYTFAKGLWCNTNSDLCTCPHRCIQICSLWRAVCRCSGTVPYVFDVHTCTGFCINISADNSERCFCREYNTCGQICFCWKGKSFFMTVSNYTESVRIRKSGFKFLFHGKRCFPGKIIFHCQCQHTNTAERHCP